MSQLTRLPVLLLLAAAARLAAQGPAYHLDVRTDPGQAVWIAMGPDLAPPVTIPGVDGLLRVSGPATVVWTGAVADARGKSRTPLPAFAFAPGYRWHAQIAGLDAQGFRLTQPFRVDGDGIAGPRAASPFGMPLDSVQAPDAPGAPRPAVVQRHLLSGDTTFVVDARRAPPPLQREPGRPGALARTGTPPEQADMGGLSIVDLADVDTFPFSAAVKLFMTFPGDPSHYYEGSGVLIDPDHVLTAGHCAYDKDLGGHADKIWVVPAYSASGESTNVPWITAMTAWGGQEPFGHSDVVEVQTWSDWRSDRDFKHDVAVLELNRPVGALAGWMGIAYQLDCDFYQENTFYVRGYPAEGPYDGSRLYTQSGAFDSCPTKWEARFDQPSYGGSSGSGVYDYDAGERWVHGVLSHAPGWYPNKTDVVRLRDEKYDDIRDWMNEHRGTVVDLTPLAVRFNEAVYASAPTSVSRGSSYAFEFTVLNYSRVARSGGLTYTWRLSTNDTISSGDTLLGSVTKTSVPVGALEILDLHDSLSIPSSIAAGTYYLGVILTTSDARSGNQITLAQDVLKLTVR